MEKSMYSPGSWVSIPRKLAQRNNHTSLQRHACKNIHSNIVYNKKFHLPKSWIEHGLKKESWHIMDWMTGQPIKMINRSIFLNVKVPFMKHTYFKWKIVWTVWFLLCSNRCIYRLPQWLCGKKSACNAGTADVGLIPGSGSFPGGGRGNPLQYSCLENLMDRGSWWATVHRVEKSWVWLMQLSRHPHMHLHYTLYLKHKQTFRKTPGYM